MTAYEMRISDWRSDVCPSDLPAAGVTLDVRVADGGQESDPDVHDRVAVRPELLRAPVVGLRRVVVVGRVAGDVLDDTVPRDSGRLAQFGRGSSRERVCRYV